jgi:enoyl-CoA hydratase
VSFVRVDKPRPHVCLVTLDRPERMNAMAFDVMVPLRETLEGIGTDNEVRVVVLTGAGRGFCAGADLVDAGYPPGIDGLALPSIGRRSMKLLEDVVTTVRQLPQPVVAAVNGRRDRRWLACHVGVQLTKQTLRSGQEASSFCAHMEHDGLAQLYVRLLTRNFEEAVTARKQGRPAVYEA